MPLRDNLAYRQQSMNNKYEKPQQWIKTNEYKEVQMHKGWRYPLEFGAMEQCFHEWDSLFCLYCARLEPQFRSETKQSNPTLPHLRVLTAIGFLTCPSPLLVVCSPKFSTVSSSKHHNTYTAAQQTLIPCIRAYQGTMSKSVLLPQ